MLGTSPGGYRRHPVSTQGLEESPERRDRLRILMVHRGIVQRRDESVEVEQLALGLSASGADVLGTDGRTSYRWVPEGDGARLVPVGRLTWRTLRSAHITFVHLPVPLVHLSVAVRARIVGRLVVLAPAGMLGDAYSRSTWFSGRHGGFSAIKPVTVAVLRRLWMRLAQLVVCLGAEEAVDARVPPGRSVVAPWASPPDWRGVEPLPDPGPRRDAPLAFVCRLDVNRKGIDRLLDWLEKNREDLPRPAVVLFAPDDGDAHPRIRSAVRRGLLHWDRNTLGPALSRKLATCRGSALLSRWESSPRALREAMVLGLPTISPPVAQLTEAVERVGAGLVIDPDEPDELQAAFEKVAYHWGDSETAASLFDRDHVGAYLYSVLRSLADGSTVPWTSYYDWYDEVRPR
jgi:glycosyltransferase involved in cell wall biosynthesis